MKVFYNLTFLLIFVFSTLAGGKWKQPDIKTQQGVLNCRESFFVVPLKTETIDRSSKIHHVKSGLFLFLNTLADRLTLERATLT